MSLMVSRFCILFSRVACEVMPKENNFTQAQCNGQSLVYVWFSFYALSYRHNCHKPYGFLRIIRSAYHSLTGGYMDPDPTPLPRRRNTTFR
ncbi:TPA: mgtA regulatory leader peptide MgtL [Citrobacter werkmanii]|uniref:mgtA regulatory leader peptide MgtL n=1 Tax=Citrobacter freundii complex TaxID=1344959 RepID=UPI0034DE1924